MKSQRHLEHQETLRQNNSVILYVICASLVKTNSRVLISLTSYQQNEKVLDHKKDS
jgi:hypothetical protein